MAPTNVTISVDLDPYDDLVDKLDLIYDVLVGSGGVLERLAAVETALNLNTVTAIQYQETIMATLDDLESTVSDLPDVIDGAVALLDTIHAELQAAIASGDPTRIQAVVDTIGTKKEDLAAAVARNTPAAPPAG